MFRATVARLLGATALTVSAIACGGGEPATVPATSAAPPAPKPMTAEERVKWYQDCWSAFSAKNWDVFKPCYADTAESDMVDSGRPPLKGPDAIVADAKNFTVAFPDAKGVPQLILENGNTIVGLYLVTGTHTGPLQGPDGKSIPATNKKIGYLVGHVIDADPVSSKAVKEFQYGDNGTFMAQLGVNPNPGRPVMETGAASPTIVIATGSDPETKNVQAYRDAAEAFNKHDVKALEAFNTPDAVFHDETQPKDMDSKGNSDMVTMLDKAFPDANLKLDSVWGAGDYVVARGVLEGTNTGAEPAMGIKQATNKPIRSQFIEIVKFDNGKFKEDWLIFDSMAFMAQLGMGPRP